VWRQSEKYSVPKIAFVNKMDRAGADFFRVLSLIEKQLGANPVPIVIPMLDEDGLHGVIDLMTNRAHIYDEPKIGSHAHDEPVPEEWKAERDRWYKHLVEKASEQDEHLLEKYCNGETIAKQELLAGLRRATLSRSIVPVLCGAAFKNKGVMRLTDAIVDFLPSPVDLPPVIGRCLDGNEIERVPKDNGRLAALAFKVTTDKHMGKLVYFRVYSGSMKSGATVLNSTRGKTQRIGRLLQMHANKQEQRGDICSGDIGVAVGLSDATTGDTLCDPAYPIVLEAIEFPSPVISVSVWPESKGDSDRLGLGLGKLAEEDPTFVVAPGEEKGETVISGMGELHLDIIIDRLKREFNVSSSIGKPEVAYKETITIPQRIRHRYKKQSGGRGQFAEVEFTIEPLGPGAGFDFVNKIVGGAIPKEYIPAVERGILETMRKGIYAGYPGVDIRVTLTDGAFHEVDSSERAFHICASQAFKHAFIKASPVLLEPIMDVCVVAPSDCAGGISGSLCGRRGQITGMDSQGTTQTTRARLPLAEMFGYATELRTLTSGRANFTMEFEHYEAVPYSVAEEIIERRKKKLEKSA
jgi:elongation factor G